MTSFLLPVKQVVFPQFTDEVSEILGVLIPLQLITGMWSLAPVFIMDIFKDVWDTSVCSPASLILRVCLTQIKMRPFS